MTVNVVIRLLFEHTDFNRCTIQALARTCNGIRNECLAKLDWYIWMRRKAASEVYFLKVSAVMYCISSGKHTFGGVCTRTRMKNHFCSPFLSQIRTVANARINLEKISKESLNENGKFCSCRLIKKKDRPVVDGITYIDDVGEGLTLLKNHQNQDAQYGWLSITYTCLGLTPISDWLRGYVPDHTNSGDDYKHFLLFGAKPNKECECEKCKTRKW